MFYGLGSDGTVGANKSAVKMIALGTELYAQVPMSCGCVGQLSLGFMGNQQKKRRMSYVIREVYEEGNFYQGVI